MIDLKNLIKTTTQPKQKKETSEKYNKKVKVFLEENQITTKKVSAKTAEILIKMENWVFPQRNQQIRIRTQVSINMIAIILKMIAKHKVIDELIIATYTLNNEATEIIIDLVKTKKITKLNLLIASSLSFRNKEHYIYLINIMKTLNQAGHQVHLTFAWMHFKITLAKCGKNYYQLEGSMNYSSNNMAEQLLIENCQEMYEEDKKFIIETVKQKENKALEIIC